MAASPLLRPAAVLALLCAVAVPAPAPACSAFLLEGGNGAVVGKSYDWSTERGLVVVNKRGVFKRALVLDAAETPARWTSRFASVTFVQYGRELPIGGMNEAGLVVEVLMLPPSRPEPADGRPVVNELQLVQYLLDEYASIEEVLAHVSDVRVVRAQAPVHYLACDARRACAALELLDGRLVATAGKAMPAKVLTNSTYAESLRRLERVRGFGGHEAAPTSQSSLDRFARLAAALQKGSSGEPRAAALRLLDGVRFPDSPQLHSTQWNIVYEVEARRVYFRTRAHPTLKTIDLWTFDFGCDSPALVLDMQTDAVGDVSRRFVPYTPEANRALVRETLTALDPALPPGAVDAVAAYPMSTSCAPPEPAPAAPAAPAAPPAAAPTPAPVSPP